jgi:multimeric flavodoxin WrbA
MKVCILLGNTRAKSNTEALTKVFVQNLEAKNVDIVQIPLRLKNINTCVGCDECHDKFDSFGCVINDDMHEISREILSSDLIVFTSPIYSWMPTPPLKSVMDRMYAFTKYPDDDEPINLMTDKKFAMISTSDEPCEENCDLFDEAVRRLASFAYMPYLGCLCAQAKQVTGTIDPKVLDDAKVFAEKCLAAFER